MIVWLIGWMGTAWANTTDLISFAQSQSYKLNNKLVVTSTDSVVLKQLKHADVPTESFPKIGDAEKEMERLLTKYPEHCILEVNPNESVIEPIAGFSVTQHGLCDEDPNLRFTIAENGSQWTVVNHRNDPVSVHTFAIVCQDIALQTRLAFEDEVAANQSRYLYYGATGLGIAGLFMNGNPDPGFTAREENRFWTSIFLLGTAAMLYTQRDVPQMFRIHKQDKLSNYYTKTQAQRRLDQTFIPIEQVNSEETTEVDEGSTEKIEHNAHTEDDTGEDTKPTLGEPSDFENQPPTTPESSAPAVDSIPSTASGTNDSKVESASESEQ